jgi:hypothetical protein
MALKPITATAPDAWASYLINGDASGITDEDQVQCDAWIAALGLGGPVTCEDAGFIRYHDAYAHCPLAADCQRYTFLVDTSQPTGPQETA